jgi:hypothetical protein
VEFSGDDHRALSAAAKCAVQEPGGATGDTVSLGNGSQQNISNLAVDATASGGMMAR